MRCEHNGVCFETLHWRYFVRCEICDRWRLRKKGEIFWKVEFGSPILNEEARIKLAKTLRRFVD